MSRFLLIFMALMLTACSSKQEPTIIVKYNNVYLSPPKELLRNVTSENIRFLTIGEEFKI